MSDKYQPKFKPEVYLKFLNNKDYHYIFVPQAMTENFLFILRDKDEAINSAVGSEWLGFCIEECLDKAILATRFDNSL